MKYLWIIDINNRKEVGMINIDYQSRMPIYMQIVKEIERYTVLDVLKPNEQIPSIRELASTLGINPNTVKKAYDILEQKGIIVTMSTKGTYIAEKKSNAINDIIGEKIASIKNEILELEKNGLKKEDIIKKISE